MYLIRRTDFMIKEIAMQPNADSIVNKISNSE